MTMQVLSLLLTAGLAHAYTITKVEQFMYKNIDPLVTPGQYVSHMHTFFGSDAVDINTNTSAELREGCSTAMNPNDFSVYWVPTLYLVDPTAEQTHTPIPIMRFSAYYELLNEAEIPLPEDFSMVIGNASATGLDGINPDPDHGISWACEGDDAEEGKDDAAFPTTTCSTHLRSLIFFPDCADPETLETGYSKNPAAYDGYGENWCPLGMKKIPRLRFSIRYDLRDILPDGWDGEPPFALSCGNSYCSHGDFINGWLPEAGEYMLQDPSKREYFEIEGPLGAGDQGTACEREATDSDPENGTSDYEESVRMMEEAEAMKKVRRRHVHYQRGAHRRGWKLL